MGRGPGRPSRDAVLAKAIQLRRQFREWKERLTNLNLPPSRIPAIPQSQGDPDDLFGSDSESDVEGANRPRAPASTISVRTRAAASGSEASGGSGAKAQRVQAALAAAPGGLGDPLKQDGASTTEFKDPAAYKERVVRAPRLSPTGRIGMATARSGSAGTGEGDRRPQPAAIPAHIKRQLAEQVPCPDMVEGQTPAEQTPAVALRDGACLNQQVQGQPTAGIRSAETRKPQLSQYKPFGGEIMR